MSSALTARAAVLRDRYRDDLWDALEWLAMPVFIVYPHLACLRWYRYAGA